MPQYVLDITSFSSQTCLPGIEHIIIWDSVLEIADTVLEETAAAEITRRQCYHREHGYTLHNLRHTVFSARQKWEKHATKYFFFVSMQ